MAATNKGFQSSSSTYEPHLRTDPPQRAVRLSPIKNSTLPQKTQLPQPPQQLSQAPSSLSSSMFNERKIAKPGQPQQQYQAPPASHLDNAQQDNFGGQLTGESPIEEINRLNARVRELESQI